MTNPTPRPRWTWLHVVFIVLLAGVLVGISALTARATETVEVYWLLPDEGTPDNVTWPQTYHPEPVCGDGWYQVDTYLAEDVPALIEDGLLHYGEDFDVVISWRFEAQVPCDVEPEPTPTPTPTPEVTPTPEPTVTPEATPTPTVEVSNDPPRDELAYTSGSGWKGLAVVLWIVSAGFALIAWSRYRAGKAVRS